MSALVSVSVLMVRTLPGLTGAGTKLTHAIGDFRSVCRRGEMIYRQSAALRLKQALLLNKQMQTDRQADRQATPQLENLLCMFKLPSTTVHRERR